MAYRANGSYLRFRTHIKADNDLSAIGRAMTRTIQENRRKNYLRDEPGIRQNQNVYDSLAE